jgi:hypothetical protein
MTKDKALALVNKIERDGEAALRQPTQSDALREALERIGVGMMPPEIIEGKLTLRLMRVDIAQEQSK